MCITAIVCILRWPTLSNQIYTFDEPAYFAQAMRLPSFETFANAFSYRVETKTQIGLIPYSASLLLDHANAIAITHVIGLLTAITTCWLLIAFAHRFLGRSLPGVAAALIWALYLEIGPGYPPSFGVRYEFFLSPKLEYYQTPFILLSMYLFIWGVDAGRKRPMPATAILFAAGIALSIALLIKPSVLPLAGLYLVALPFLRIHEGGNRERLIRWVRMAAPFLLGIGLPVAIVFVPYFFRAGGLADLQFNLIYLNTQYAQSTPILVRLFGMLLGVPVLLLLAFLLTPSLMRTQPGDEGSITARRNLNLVACVGIAVFVGYLSGQGYVHYLIPVIPLLALAVTGYLDLGLRALADRGYRRRALCIAIGLAVLYLGPQIPAVAAYPALASSDFYLTDDRQRFDLDGLLAYIQAHSRPSASIWVYYNTPEIYLLSNRHPATQAPDGMYLTIYWDDIWFQRTARELAAEQPALLIDIANPQWPRPRGPMKDIPLVGAWIAQNYHCDSSAVRGAVVCIRNGAAPISRLP